MSQEKLQFKTGMSPEESLALAQTMLDSNFDDIADLAEFVNLPMGTYLFDVLKAEVGLNADKTGTVIKVVLEVVDTLELAAYPQVKLADLPEGAAPVPGSLASFQYHGAIGIAKFKKCFGDVPTQLGCPTPKSFIELMGSGQVKNLAGTTTLRADKEKVDVLADGTTKPKMYSELVSVILA